jgi:hypothetical protein
MNDDDKPRLVSGEIMTDARVRATVPVDKTDVIDVDFEPVKVLTRANANVIGASSRGGGPLFWSMGLALVGLAFWVSGGHAIVRQQVAALMPAGAGEQLRIDGVTSRIERHNGRDILFLKGRAENPGTATQKLPSLAIVVRANDGTTTNYFLGTNDTALASGDRYSFSSRLEAPRDGVKSVSVTFREPPR